MITSSRIYLRYCAVSYTSITNASKDGRTSYPQQAAQVGDTASTIAAILGWKTGSRVPSFTDDKVVPNIVFDGPGVMSSGKSES